MPGKKTPREGKDRKKGRRRSSRVSSGDDASFLTVIVIILLTLWVGPCAEKDHGAIEDLSALTRAQQEQIETMQRSQAAHERFVRWVDEQMADAKLTIAELREETGRFDAIVETKQEQVDAIFEEGERWRRRNIWKDWIATFLLGCASTLFVQFLWKRVSSRRNDRDPIGEEPGISEEND